MLDYALSMTSTSSSSAIISRIICLYCWVSSFGSPADASGSADGEALIVEQTADLADHQHVEALIIPAVSASLDGVELRKFLFPITQNVRFYRAELADLTDGEVAFARDRR